MFHENPPFVFIGVSRLALEEIKMENKGKFLGVYLVGNTHIFMYENMDYLEYFNKSDGFQYHDTEIIIPDIENIEDIRF